MSALENLKNIIPKVIVGSARYTTFESIPEDYPVKNLETLLPLIIRSYDAGAEGCLFYLYNDEMVQFLNILHRELRKIKIMLIIKFVDIGEITRLMNNLNFTPTALFLDYNLADQRDNDLINKYINALSKYCKNIGIYTREPIGTVSFFITSNPKINLFLLPFNMLGLGLQNRSLIEMIVNSSENIYIASNPLAEGKIKPRQAFEYVTTHRIHGSSIEFLDLETVLDSIKFAKYFLETHDFLQIALEFEDHSEVCETCGLGMTRYYPPTGGSWWYCSQCQAKKELPK